MKHLTIISASQTTDRPGPSAWPWLSWLALAGLVVGAFALRAWTIGQSLPFVDHPDEPVHLDQVITMLRTGDPNQQVFWKPSLHTYILLTAIQAHLAWGRAIGIYESVDKMLITTHIVTTVPGFFLTARLVTAVLGALTVIGAWALGVRGWNGGAGLIGAMLVAGLPWHVRFSQWATTDVLATFLVALSLSMTFVALHDGTWRAYLVAGAFAGLAASAKYNAGMAAGAIIAAAGLRAWKQRNRGYTALLAEGVRLTGAGVAALMAFIAGTPYALLRWNQVRQGIVEQWHNYGGGNGHYQGAWNVGGYVEFFVGTGLSLSGCCLVLAGLIILAMRRPSVLGVWLGFVAPSLLLHLSRPTHFMQNMLPILIACALPAGVAAVELPRLLARHTIVWRGILLIGLSGALVLPSASRTFAEVRRQVAGDSRVQLLNWINIHVPPGARIAAELTPIPDPTEPRWTYVPYLPAHDRSWYRSQGYAYLIATSHSWRQIVPPPAYQPFMPYVVAEFGPRLRREEMLGPHILVIDTGLTTHDALLPLADDVRIGGARLRGVTIGQPSDEGAPPLLAPATTFSAGDVLGLRTFWEIEDGFATDYFIFVHVLDAAGNRPAQRDAPPWQGRYPTTSWRTGSLVVDHNDVYLPPTMTPGTYRIVVGMYDPHSGARAPVTRNGITVPDGAVEVATITVTSPRGQER